MSKHDKDKPKWRETARLLFYISLWPPILALIFALFIALRT